MELTTTREQPREISVIKYLAQDMADVGPIFIQFMKESAGTAIDRIVCRH